MEEYSALAFLILVDFGLCIVLAVHCRDANEKHAFFFFSMMLFELLRQTTNFALTVTPLVFLLPISGTLDLMRGVALFLAVLCLVGRQPNGRWIAYSLLPYAAFIICLIALKVEPLMAWTVSFLPILASHIGATLLLARKWRRHTSALRFLQSILVLHAPVLIAQSLIGPDVPGLSPVIYFLDSITIVLLAMAAIMVSMERLQRQLQKSTQAIVDSEERYRTVFDSAFDGIISIDEKGAIVDLNPSAQQMFGWKEIELVGRPCGESLLSTYSEREFRISCKEYFSGNDSSQLLNGREANAKRKDETPFPVELTLRPGRRERHRTLNVFIRDVTEAKQAEAERHKLEAQMLHSQKLESLGVLAGGIAHDFNNLLVGMLGFVSLAKEQSSPEESIYRDLEEAEKAAQKAAELTSQMLSYAGKGRLTLRSVEVSAIVEDMRALIESTVSRKAQLEYDLKLGLPAANGDASQLFQIVLNLVANASDALTNKSGVIRISTGELLLDDSYLDTGFFSHVGTKGPQVYIEATDSGCGMDSETVSRMFDPFYSTKFTGRGLGMAAVLGIVTRHDGTIRVISEPGKGTTITVLIPCRAQPSESEECNGVTSSLLVDDMSNISGTVLVVDDEPSVRELLKRYLGKKGLKVITARDGQEGVDLYLEHSDRLSLVILDLTMPRLGGLEAFEAMTRIDSSIPVILSSGYSDDIAHESFGDLKFSGFVQKPYSPSELMTTVTELLADSDKDFALPSSQ